MFFSSYGLKLSALYRHPTDLGLHRVGYNGRRSTYPYRQACLPRQGKSLPDTGRSLQSCIFIVQESGRRYSPAIRTPPNPGLPHLCSPRRLMAHSFEKIWSRSGTCSINMLNLRSITVRQLAFGWIGGVEMPPSRPPFPVLFSYCPYPDISISELSTTTRTWVFGDPFLLKSWGTDIVLLLCSLLSRRRRTLSPGLTLHLGSFWSSLCTLGLFLVTPPPSLSISGRLGSPEDQNFPLAGLSGPASFR